MKYLLDTNICIAVINGKPEKVRLNAAEALDRNGQFTTSSIVVHGLWYGVAKSRQVDRNARALLGFLSRDIEVLDYNRKGRTGGGGNSRRTGTYRRPHRGIRHLDCGPSLLQEPGAGDGKYSRIRARKRAGCGGLDGVGRGSLGGWYCTGDCVGD